MDEEKTIDEAVDEQADEMKEFEPVAFDEVIKETEPERKDAPVLRDAPDPADMNMIHKHLDNFLAMLCGETPIDDNVRNSTEYWLKRLAEGLGGSTKKVYSHVIKINAYNNQICIVNGDSTEFTTATLAKYLYDNGYVSLTSGFSTSGYSVVQDGAFKIIRTLYSTNGTTITLDMVTLSATINDGAIILSSGPEPHNVTVQSDIVTAIN